PLKSISLSLFVSVETNSVLNGGAKLIAFFNLANFI
ncbi:MAG: hypothetical protein ACJAY8_000486, partial [Sphingobacteriales bacterium]